MKNEVTAIFDRNTWRKHRFLIQEKEGITGTIYILKEQKVPDIVKVCLKTKGELEKESSQPGMTGKKKHRPRPGLKK